MSLEQAIQNLADAITKQNELLSKPEVVTVTPAPIEKVKKETKAKVEKVEPLTIEAEIVETPKVEPKKTIASKIEVIDYEIVKTKTLEVLRAPAYGRPAVEKILANYGKDLKSAKDVPDDKRGDYLKEIDAILKQIKAETEVA